MYLQELMIFSGKKILIGYTLYSSFNLSKYRLHFDNWIWVVLDKGILCNVSFI